MKHVHHVARHLCYLPTFASLLLTDDVPLHEQPTPPCPAYRSSAGWLLPCMLAQSRWDFAM